MSQDATVNNKRIAKNTLLLYVRMLFIMGVQLFTSRVVLNTLGVVDYGIYNVVGGVVSMFAFLKGAMVTSTQRYLTFELGRGNFQRLRVVFSTSVQIHLIISLVIVLLGETVGLWFFYEKMVIPPERFTAAMWVYQLSILAMVVQVMSVPYNSAIVAHEQMGIFAAISVVEVVLRLAVVYLLVIGGFDKLIFYAILIALVQLVIRFLYTQYCSRKYKESRLIRTFDKSLVKEMGKFMGWNIWGHLAATLFGTGLNLLLNVFFGPVVNAARAVAVQVETAIANFSTNFLMAVNPQITKLYAQDNLPEMHRLIFRASKFTFFLLFTLSLPVMIETEPILTVWLKIVPDYTVIFLRLLLCIVMIDAVAKPLMTAAAATGNVKLYQSLIGGILLSIAPIAYVVLKLGGSPESVYIVHLVICCIAFVTRLMIIRPMIRLSLRRYFTQVILRCVGVIAIPVLSGLLLKDLLPATVPNVILICAASALLVLASAYAIGLTRDERAFVTTKAQTTLGHFRNRQDR